MLELVYKIFAVIGCIGIAICVYMAAKNNNTYRMQMKILDAIYAYNIDCIKGNKVSMVNFEDIESYKSTYFRLWDWGYKNILPKEKYEIIKPYIK